MISATNPDQQAPLEALQAALDAGTIENRSTNFANDLIRKGQQKSLSEKQMYWVNKLAQAPAVPTAVSTAASAELTDALDALEAVRANIKGRQQTFALDLIRKGRKNGHLSSKQMYWVKKMTADGAEAGKTNAQRMAERDARRAAQAAAREAHRIGTTPVSDDEADTGWEAVMEMFDAAGETLTRMTVRLLTEAGREVVIRSARRKGERNDILYVQTNGCDRNDRDAQFGHITKATAAWNHTPFTTTDVRETMELFKNDPINVVAEMGRKLGRCCFCALPLSDHRSTAHGYGPICAGKWRLPWSHETAFVIEGTINEKVNTVILVKNDVGLFEVIDVASGDTLATFDSRQQANDFADNNSMVIEG